MLKSWERESQTDSCHYVQPLVDACTRGVVMVTSLRLLLGLQVTCLHAHVSSHTRITLTSEQARFQIILLRDIVLHRSEVSISYSSVVFIFKISKTIYTKTRCIYIKLIIAATSDMDQKFLISTKMCNCVSKLLVLRKPNLEVSTNWQSNMDREMIF
jgi:hypothetical protein